ncbi:MAG: cytochrome ubiquinol oxidase subunit I [Thermoplasmata archaeon]
MRNKQLYLFILLFAFFSISSLSLSETLSTSYLQNNANAAEPMTILGIYVHGFFLTFAVGLPYLVLTYEFLGIRKNDKTYLKAAKTLSLVWGISFGIGAATGTLVEFGLVQVWSGTLLAIATFFFAPLTLELYAFMLEIVFVVVYLFTWDINRPSYRHFILGIILAFGSNLSAYMILAVNAFMNVPWGTGNLVSQILPWSPTYGPNYVNTNALLSLYEYLNKYHTLSLASSGLFLSTGTILYNQWVVLYNPYLYATFFHTVLATIVISSFEASAFLGLDMIRNRDFSGYRKKLIRVSFGVGAIASILIPISGDYMGRIVYQFQYLKFLAFEGFGPNGGKDPIMGMLLYGNPNYYFKGYNYLLSLAKNSLDPANAINSILYIENQFQPWAFYVYWSMVMSGIILFIFAIIYFGFYIKWIESIIKMIFRMDITQFISYASLIAPILGIIAASSGWAVREAGRHPWVIYGLIQYWQVITPDPITPWLSILIIMVELIILILGSWAILYVIRRRDKND